MANEGVNLMMVEYEENVNLIAKINTELCKTFGLEHYLTEFSSNLIRALNQYKRFVLMMDERKTFVESIIKFSESCISFFEVSKSTKEEETKQVYEKMNVLVKRLNEINEQINAAYKDAIEEYLKTE